MLKTGTGLLLDIGRRVTITSVALELGPYAGADLQLRAGNTATLPGLRVAARVNGAGSTLRLRLRSPPTARYLLIWFTLLPPNGAGRCRAGVSGRGERSPLSTAHAAGCGDTLGPCRQKRPWSASSWAATRTGP